MKFKNFGLVAMMVAICLICSCGGGSGSDSDNAQKTVAIDFSIGINDTSYRAINVSNQTYDDIEIWYKATPKWTSEFGDIQGDTSKNSAAGTDKFVKLTDIANNKFTYANPTGTVGYFAQGYWEFEIEVRKPQTTGAAVLWKTSAPVKEYINATNTSLIFTVKKNIDSTKTGTVAFDVSTNKKSKTDFFEVSWTPINGGTSTDITNLTQTGTGNVTADEAKISGSTTLKAGFYAITVKYYSAEGATNMVGASTVSAEVIPGGDITISGTIENQKYQQTTFTVKGMYKLAVTVEATSTTGEKVIGKDANNNDITIPTVVAGTPIEFKATPALTDLAGNAVTGVAPTYYYKWNNGTASTTNTYSLTPEAGQVYCDCVAYAMDGETMIGSASFTFKFEAEVAP